MLKNDVKISTSNGTPTFNPLPRRPMPYPIRPQRELSLHAEFHCINFVDIKLLPLQFKSIFGSEFAVW